MRWQKISLSILTVTLLGWTVSAAIAADVDTDKSIIAVSAKIEEERELTPAELLARSQELNKTYETSRSAASGPPPFRRPRLQSSSESRSSSKSAALGFCPG